MRARRLSFTVRGMNELGLATLICPERRPRDTQLLLPPRHKREQLALWSTTIGSQYPQCYSPDKEWCSQSLPRLHQLLIHKFERFGADTDISPEWIVHGG